MTHSLDELFFTHIDRTIFQSRMVMIYGPVNSHLAYDVNRQLMALEAADANKPIYLLINSPGGEVTSGFSIYDTARFIKPEIITLVTGLAASMGSLIALCASKENRLAFPNAKFLIHQPLISGVIQGQASDLAIHALDIVKTKEKINKLYAQETGKPLAVVTEATDRDNWMDVQQAKEFGLISRIVSERSDLK